MASTNVIKRKLLVLGGNGYVGQAICRAALQSSAFDVVRSLSRSGAPSTAMGGLSRVEWVKGDVFDTPALSDVMFNDIDIVISVIGAFGSNEYMQRICGDATINAVQVAKDMMGVGKVSTFGFISSAQVYDGSVALCLPPSAPVYGYFQGKRRAEEELLKCFPNNLIRRTREVRVSAFNECANEIKRIRETCLVKISAFGGDRGFIVVS